MSCKQNGSALVPWMQDCEFQETQITQKVVSFYLEIFIFKFIKNCMNLQNMFPI